MRGWLRAGWATLTSPPWRRAPWLLWRRAGVLAMVAGATLVLVTPLAAVPLFLSSVGSASVTEQARDRCPRDTGATYTAPVAAADVGELRRDPLAPLSGTLGPSTVWTSLSTTLVGRLTPEIDREVMVLARDGATDHIDVVEGEAGEAGATGAWVTDRSARDTGLRPGDEAVLGGTRVPVVGVYRDLAGTTVDDYWCSHGDLLMVEGNDPVLPPPVVIVDRATFGRLMSDQGLDPVGVAWETRLRPGLTVAEARTLADDLACATPTRTRLEWCPEGPMPEIVVERGFLPSDPGDRVSQLFDTSLPFVIDRAASIRTSVGGGVWPVAGCAALAGVGFVAAAGALWFDRRRREVTLLTVRGVSPAGLGLKAVLELVVPLVAGAAGGVALAEGLVRWLGPSSDLEASAVARARESGALGLAVAVLAVGVVVARRSGALVRRVRWHRPGWLRAVPWELALAAVTVVSYRRLGEWGVPVSDGAAISRVDALGLLFPVLFLLSAVGVAARLLVLGLGPLLRLSRGWPTSLYLAVRRVARYRVAVVGLVAASAVAAGVLGYAATLNRSLEATLDLKARVFVGSDVAVRLTNDDPLPAPVDRRATIVASYRSAWIGADGNGDNGSSGSSGGTGADDAEVSVIAIDPATFAGATFWDATFSSTGIDEIMDRLALPAQASGGEAIPAVVIGNDEITDPRSFGNGDGTIDARIRGIRTARFAIEPVAEVRGFPGMRRPTPTVFVAADNLRDLDVTGASTEAWIRGDRDAVLGALDRAGTRYVEARRAGEVVDRMSFLTVAWTFDFVQAIAVAAGLLVVGGLAAYLDARRRNRLLGYAFAKRMGLTSGQHRLALLAELAASVVVGCWLGLGIALAGAWLAHDRIDPVPDFRPDPVLRPATAVVLALAATATVVALVAAVLAQNRTDRDTPVDVLRAGT